MTPINVRLLNWVLPVKVMLLTSGSGKVGAGWLAGFRIRAQDRHTGKKTLAPNSLNSHRIHTSGMLITTALSLATAVYAQYDWPTPTFWGERRHCNIPGGLGHDAFTSIPQQRVSSRFAVIGQILIDGKDYTWHASA